MRPLFPLIAFVSVSLAAATARATPPVATAPTGPTASSTPAGAPSTYLDATVNVNQVGQTMAGGRLGFALAPYLAFDLGLETSTDAPALIDEFSLGLRLQATGGDVSPYMLARTSAFVGAFGSGLSAQAGAGLDIASGGFDLFAECAFDFQLGLRATVGLGTRF